MKNTTSFTKHSISCNHYSTFSRNLLSPINNILLQKSILWYLNIKDTQSIKKGEK